MIQCPLYGQTRTPSSEAGTRSESNVLLWRKVGQDVWAIRERYFESSINQANIYFFQVWTKSFHVCSLIMINELWTEGQQRGSLDRYGSWRSRGSSWNLASREKDNHSFVTFVVQSESPQLPPFLSSSGLRPNVEKPLSVLITHMHFDHSGGAHQFEEVPLALFSISSGSIYFSQVAGHTSEVAALQSGNSLLCCSWLTDDEVVGLWNNLFYFIISKGKSQARELEGQRLWCKAM